MKAGRGKRLSAIGRSKAPGALSPLVWARRYGPRNQNQRLPGCPEDYHSATGYDFIRDHKKFCVKDCNLWPGQARRTARKGQCRTPKTAWMRGLLNYYRDRHTADPRFTYSMAMKAFKPIYQKHLQRQR
jgi:hypothetical protein